MARTAFTLGNVGPLNTEDTYRQLQAPAQRQAIASSLSASAAKNAPTVETISNRSGSVSSTYTVPGNGPNYTEARRLADLAAMQATISPSDLVRMWTAKPGTAVSPSRSSSAVQYRPVESGVFNTTPKYDWDGRIMSGPGATSSVPKSSSEIMHNLVSGQYAQQRDYQNVIDGSVKAANYAATQQSLANHQQYYASQSLFK